MSGLELCPKCKWGHLYPAVTSSLSTESQFNGIREYECAICAYKQRRTKQMQKVHIENKVRGRVNKSKKTKAKTRTERKTTKL